MRLQEIQLPTMLIDSAEYNSPVDWALRMFKNAQHDEYYDCHKCLVEMTDGLLWIGHFAWETCGPGCGSEYDGKFGLIFFGRNIEDVCDSGNEIICAVDSFKDDIEKIYQIVQD